MLIISFKQFSYHKSKMYLELCIVKPLSTKQRGLFQLQMEESRSYDVLNTLSSDTTKQIRVHSMDPSTRQHALRDITHTATSLLYITRWLMHETFWYLHQTRVFIRDIKNSLTINYIRLDLIVDLLHIAYLLTFQWWIQKSQDRPTFRQ